MRGLQPARRARHVGLLVVAATAGAALTLIPVAQAAFPGRNGRLASSYAYGCGTPIIITITSDGATPESLTRCDSSDDPPQVFGPDWSPNGRRILFTHRSGSASARIAVMNADGSRQRDVALTGLQPIPPVNVDQVTDVGSPSFAPDGKHFVYQRSYSTAGSIGENTGTSEIWVAALDGSEDRMLRPGSSPLWSPDGRRIVYIEPPQLASNTAVKDGGTWLMNAQTGHRSRRLARSSLSVLDWSPDAQRLLYFRSDELRVMRADGTGRRKLTISARLRLSDAVFSPDGLRIAFSGTRYLGDQDQRDGIWTMSARGSRPGRIFASEIVKSYERDTGPPTSLSWQARTRR